jgi:hypothetical protein
MNKKYNAYDHANHREKEIRVLSDEIANRGSQVIFSLFFLVSFSHSSEQTASDAAAASSCATASDDVFPSRLSA